MNSTPVLVEQPDTVTAIRRAVLAKNAEAPRNGHEAIMIVVIAIVIAFTFTVCVIGTILILLALRGSGVMAAPWMRIPQLG